MLRAGTWSLVLSAPLLLLTGALGRAQTPPQNPAASNAPPAQVSPQPKPVTGFVTSYEIMRTVRAAGFEPLAPPLREGTSYVLRATDFRGILMRVVLDARTGVIRDVTRIVSDASAPYGVVAPAYGSSATYDPPAGLTGPRDEGESAPRSTLPAAEEPRSSARAFVPPLPRPRPRFSISHRAQHKVRAAEMGAGRNDAFGARPPVATIGVNAGAAAAPSAEQGRTSATVPPIND